MVNSRNEYAEEVEKDTINRGEYYHGIVDFLQGEKIRVKNQRETKFTPEEYKKNSEFYRGELIKMLGFPLTQKRGKTALLEKKFVARDKNVNIYRVRLSSVGEIPFYGLYFEQIDEKHKKPFVLCFHGAEGTPELISGIYMDSANYNHIVRRLTDYGANVFVPQFLLWNIQRYGNPYNRLHIDGKLRQLGGSITALELSLLCGALDYFIADEKIDSQKIGVVGLSYGGMYALHLAAVDTRIKSCYSCSWVCDGFEHSFADWSYYNAQYISSTVETAACISPRPLVIAMGNKDELFHWETTERIGQQVRKFYQAFDKDNNLKVCIFDGNHEMNKEDDSLIFFLTQLVGR